MSVSAEENKQMLIDLMKNIMQDNNFTLDNDGELRRFIIEKCNYYHTQRFEFGDLGEINKKIVEMSYNYLLMKNKRPNQLKTISEENMTRREMFNKGLEIQQKNFDNMIQPNKPEEIDFTDANKDMPINNLNVIMNQTLADRQKALMNITQQYTANDQTKAKKWLKMSNNEENTPKIQIEHNTSLSLINTIDVSKGKKVRFQVQEKNDNLTGLFSKLKVKSNNNPVTQHRIETGDEKEIIKKLNVIISNQEKILNLLQLKSKELNSEEL